eukprot:6207449-Pleurochrysis_carterae.AAC.1
MCVDVRTNASCRLRECRVSLARVGSPAGCRGRCPASPTRAMCSCRLRASRGCRQTRLVGRASPPSPCALCRSRKQNKRSWQGHRRVEGTQIND